MPIDNDFTPALERAAEMRRRMNRLTLRERCQRTFRALFGRCKACGGELMQSQPWQRGFFYKCEDCHVVEFHHDKS